MADLKSVDTGRTANGHVIRNKHSVDKMRQGQNEKLLALALEATNDGIWVWHIPTGEAYFNPRYYTMLGYEPDELPANYATWASLLHPEDLKKTKETIQKHIENKSESFEEEFRLQTKSGDWLWIIGRGKVVEWDDGGHPIRMVGSHINNDTRKRVEQELTRYREQLENMVNERTIELEQTTSLLEATFNAIPDVLGVQDNQHRIIRYNAAGYRFLNMTHEEVAGKRCFELIGQTEECALCATSECYRTKKPASIERYEKALDAWLDVRAYPVLDEKGNIIKVIEHLRDITATKMAEKENRRLNEQLIHAQKMESLGTLAGGIAHDFNNLLMAIQGRASLMLTDLEPYSSHLRHIKAIENCIRSATDLTKQLLGFARGGKYEVKPTEINELINNSAHMFGRTKKEIRIHTKFQDPPAIVAIDRTQIEQVLLNLYINAWQAMPDGGELYLETHTVTLDEVGCKPHKVKPGRYAKVSVTDTGIGMDKTVRKRIFDPFFTTKEKGRGTGLGLASAYGIIKNHDGIITVYSETGHGTTFNIYLPLSTQDACIVAALDEGLVKGSETVLLVDDEKMILDVGREMLEKLGYRVFVAVGGEQAIEMVKRKGARIDLVVLDLIMPGMEGGKVFDGIREIRPQMPVMLASGYAINGQADEIMKRDCNGFLQKPFNISELSKKVREILDKTKSAAHRS